MSRKSWPSSTVEAPCLTGEQWGRLLAAIQTAANERFNGRLRPLLRWLELPHSNFYRWKNCPVGVRRLSKIPLAEGLRLASLVGPSDLAVELSVQIAGLTFLPGNSVICRDVLTSPCPESVLLHIQADMFAVCDRLGFCPQLFTFRKNGRFQVVQRLQGNKCAWELHLALTKNRQTELAFYVKIDAKTLEPLIVGEMHEEHLQFVLQYLGNIVLASVPNLYRRTPRSRRLIENFNE